VKRISNCFEHTADHEDHEDHEGHEEPLVQNVLRDLRDFRGVVISCALVVLSPYPANAQSHLTFTKDIAPIVWARCATCHRPGEIGPFSLVTYDDVKRRATQIAEVTSRRIMPPWKPEPGKGEFESERRLTDEELRKIQQWISDGAPEGDAADLPPRPVAALAMMTSSGWQLGSPDLVVSMSEPYTVRSETDVGGDVFRTFVLPIPVTRPRYVRAIEFRPGNARVVHHANLGIDRTRSSRLLDLRDAEPGYAGGMVRDARYPEGHLLGWTPGQAPHPAAPGLAWRLDPGSDLVAQLHLQPTGKPEPLRVSVGFFFTDDPPARTPVGLRLGSETIDIPPGERRYTIADRYVVPVDVDVLAIQPHAHNLARRMEATAILPDGGMQWLIAIDDWDFRWQDVYRYKRPLMLPKGTTIAMRYEYDNSAANPRNPHSPPARVVWGQNTTDEMGDLWIQMAARANGGFTALSEDVERKRSTEDLTAYTKLLQADPANPLRHDAVAMLYLEARRLDDAIGHFRQSLELNPSSASTHYNLGYALALRGHRDEAVTHFREALRLDPGYAQAHNNLAAMLQLAGRVDEALDHFRRAVALRPDNVEAHDNLAHLLSREGHAKEAVAEFEKALALKSDDPQALSGVAWIRATAADASLRDAPMAIALAERAATLTSRGDLSALDALAAAYASGGRYDEAVAVARTAIAHAIGAGQAAAAAQFRERLALYQKGQPYRSPR
jgi:tetratricopeptide (TPR) repeat protein